MLTRGRRLRAPTHMSEGLTAQERLATGEERPRTEKPNLFVTAVPS